VRQQTDHQSIRFESNRPTTPTLPISLLQNIRSSITHRVHRYNNRSSLRNGSHRVPRSTFAQSNHRSHPSKWHQTESHNKVMHPTPRINTSQTQKVHALLLQIPPGRVSSYAALARALQTSPRAIGGALRRNPFAPEVVSPILSFPTFHPYFPLSPVPKPTRPNHVHKLTLPLDSPATAA
jgi:hypothetical protein